MAKFVTIGDGGRNGYDRTEAAIRDAEHEHDAIAQPGSEHGHRRAPMQVRNLTTRPASRSRADLSCTPRCP